MHLEVWGPGRSGEEEGKAVGFMADTRRAQAVDCATSISKAIVMYVQRTWRSGGRGGRWRGEWEPHVYIAAKGLRVGPQASTERV